MIFILTASDENGYDFGIEITILNSASDVASRDQKTEL